MRTWPFGFRKQFAPAVQGGTKLQTVRAERRDGKRPVVGDRVSLWSGMRTSSCTWLNHGTVTACFSVTLRFEDGALLFDGKQVSGIRAETFAQQDGFGTFAEMESWFHETHGPRDFTGFCVQWKPEARS
jgi:hypothetical protein